MDVLSVDDDNNETPQKLDPFADEAKKQINAHLSNNSTIMPRFYFCFLPQRVVHCTTVILLLHAQISVALILAKCLLAAMPLMNLSER